MKKFNIKSFKLGFVLSILFITSCSVIDALDRADAAYWNEYYGYERYEVKQTEQQQAELKKQQQAQALINLGTMIGGAGVPNNSQLKTKPKITSYSDSFSISRTVPSNRNCPLLSAPLKKQEVRNGNRICYY